MASKEDAKSLSSSDEKLGKSQSRSHRKHRDSPVTTEKASRSKNGAANKSHSRHSAKSSVVGVTSNADSVESQTTNGSKAQGPSKKSILKFMIHEVRELRRQLDPGSEDLGSKYGKHRDNAGADDSDNETMNQTYPPSGSGAMKGSQEGLMHTAPFMASIFRPTADTNDLTGDLAGEAVAMDTGQHILDQLRL